MNRYVFIRRLYAPAVLLLLGIIALLNQLGIGSWNLFVPLLLIMLGVLKLAERAALAADPYYGMPYGGLNPGTGPYPGQPYPGQPYPGQMGGQIVPPPAAGEDANGGGQ